MYATLGPPAGVLTITTSLTEKSPVLETENILEPVPKDNKVVEVTFR
jgi:hypothetical protein